MQPGRIPFYRCVVVGARAVTSPAAAEVSTCNRSAMLLRDAPTLALTKLMPQPTIAAIQPEGDHQEAGRHDEDEGGEADDAAGDVEARHWLQCYRLFADSHYRLVSSFFSF